MESIRHIQQHQVSMMEIVLKTKQFHHIQQKHTYIQSLIFFCLCAPCPDDGFIFIFFLLYSFFLLVCFLYLYLSLSFIIYTYIYTYIEKKNNNTHISLEEFISRKIFQAKKQTTHKEEWSFDEYISIFENFFL